MPVWAGGGVAGTWRESLARGRGAYTERMRTKCFNCPASLQESRWRRHSSTDPGGGPLCGDGRVVPVGYGGRELRSVRCCHVWSSCSFVAIRHHDSAIPTVHFTASTSRCSSHTALGTSASSNSTSTRHHVAASPQRRTRPVKVVRTPEPR